MFDRKKDQMSVCGGGDRGNGIEKKTQEEDGKKNRAGGVKRQEASVMHLYRGWAVLQLYIVDSGSSVSKSTVLHSWQHGR